jgi:hypothetical protein
MGRLVCVDPLTGAERWSHDGLQVGCDLFGDEEILVVVPRELSTAQLFSTIDGRHLGEVSLPSWDSQVATIGRNAIHWKRGTNQRNRQMELSSIDAATGETRWSHGFAIGALVDCALGRYVAVVERGERIAVFDATTGEQLIDQPYQSTASIKELHLFAGADQFTLAIERPPARHDPNYSVRPINSLDFVVFTGEVFCFDRQSGEPLFDGPATIESQALVLYQGVDLPVLAFAGTVRPRGAGGSRPGLSLLLLEKESGRLLLKDDSLPQSNNLFQVQASREQPNTIVVEMQQCELKLEYTGRPRPPEPPVNEAVLSASDKRSGGLLEIGRQIIGAE